MRTLSTLLIVLVTLLGIASSGEAQPSARLEIDGTIQSVDCTAQQLTLRSGSGATLLQSTLASVIRVDGGPATLCSLQPFVGAPVMVSIVPVDGQFMIAELTVRSSAPVVPTAPYPPAPYAPAPSQVSGPAPTIAGGVLGTMVVGGFLYLLVQGANGAFYRYPYYGQYYRTYYQPSYRPYVGPARPTLTYGPYRRCRDRTWSQWCY